MIIRRYSEHSDLALPVVIFLFNEKQINRREWFHFHRLSSDIDILRHLSIEPCRRLANEREFRTKITPVQSEDDKHVEYSLCSIDLSKYRETNALAERGERTGSESLS